MKIGEDVGISSNGALVIILILEWDFRWNHPAIGVIPYFRKPPSCILGSSSFPGFWRHRDVMDVMHFFPGLQAITMAKTSTSGWQRKLSSGSNVAQWHIPKIVHSYSGVPRVSKLGLSSKLRCQVATGSLKFVDSQDLGWIMANHSFPVKLLMNLRRGSRQINRLQTGFLVIFHFFHDTHNYVFCGRTSQDCWSTIWQLAVCTSCPHVLMLQSPIFHRWTTNFHSNIQFQWLHLTQCSQFDPCSKLSVIPFFRLENVASQFLDYDSCTYFQSSTPPKQSSTITYQLSPYPFWCSKAL